MGGGVMPIRKHPARLWGHGPGTLLLYPDKLAHVSSRAANVGGGAGFIAVFAVSWALARGGPGALGGAIGAGGGWMIGAAIAQSQAAGKVAAGGSGVTVIPLVAITSLRTIEPAGIGGVLGGKSLLVTTADRAEYRFGVKLDNWSADLAGALTARGRVVHVTPEGMTVTPAPSGNGRPLP